MEAIVTTLEELEAEAARFVGTLAPGREGATLVTLSGELGAGKTAFVKAVAKALGVAESVTSPTFVLEKIYALPQEHSGYRKSRFKRLVHIDAYRLEGREALAPLGFDELVREAGNLILLEWPERVEGALPPADVRISIQLNEDSPRLGEAGGSRTITYGT